LDLPKESFFSKILKIELNKGQKKFILEWDSITPRNLKFFITCIFSFKIEWFKAFHIHTNLGKPSSNFYFLKKSFFWVAWGVVEAKKMIEVYCI